MTGLETGLATLEVERRDHVVTVTLDRPEKLNAMNGQMFGELARVFADVADRDDDRVLVITGRGRGFCSGADVSPQANAADEGPSRHSLEQMRSIGDAALRLHRLAKPTIAKVNGVAAGAGLNLALGCDLVVASEEARFSQIFARRGLSIDFGGSWLLPRLVGMQRAKELALLADMISAEEAWRLGLVNRVVPAGELDAVVADWAARLVAGPPLALSMTKTLLNNAFAVSMEQALEDEARCQAVNLATADAAEAALAFVEKRPPTFLGR